jgi:hypothetical protein
MIPANRRRIGRDFHIFPFMSKPSNISCRHSRASGNPQRAFENLDSCLCRNDGYLRGMPYRAAAGLGFVAMKV